MMENGRAVPARPSLRPVTVTVRVAFQLLPAPVAVVSKVSAPADSVAIDVSALVRLTVTVPTGCLERTTWNVAVPPRVTVTAPGAVISWKLSLSMCWMVCEDWLKPLYFVSLLVAVIAIWYWLLNVPAMSRPVTVTVCGEDQLAAVKSRPPAGDTVAAPASVGASARCTVADGWLVSCTVKVAARPFSDV